MRKLTFATNNPHKLEEIHAHLKGIYEVVSLSEMGINIDIPEDHLTLEENAHQKAEFIYQNFGLDCFADDTGLEIDVLNGEPGVFSARYSKMPPAAYPDVDIATANMNKVLDKLIGESRRSARFRTVIVLILRGKEHTFEGIVQGEIAQNPSGVKGFGYDPIFIPEGYDISFAEMNIEEKNKISHRAKAVNQLVQFLKSTNI